MWSANNDFRKAKKQNKLLTQPFLILKALVSTFYYWASQFATAIALEVIKYKAGQQFTFHDDAKSQRKTTTVWISGVESLKDNLTMSQPATKRIVLAFLIYFFSTLNS